MAKYIFNYVVFMWMLTPFPFTRNQVLKFSNTGGLTPLAAVWQVWQTGRTGDMQVWHLSSVAIVKQRRTKWYLSCVGLLFQEGISFYISKPKVTWHFLPLNISISVWIWLKWNISFVFQDLSQHKSWATIHANDLTIELSVLSVKTRCSHFLKYSLDHGFEPET